METGQTTLPPEHQALSGTPLHGLGIDGRPAGSGCMTTPVAFGYTMSDPHGPLPVSHSTCPNSAPPVTAPVVVTPHFGWVFCRSAGDEPAGATLPE